jgi:hypothetical protein
MMAMSGPGNDNRVRLVRLSAVAALMVVPVIGLRVADAHVWDPGDIIFLAILLGVIALAHELLLRVSDRRSYAVGIGLALFAGLAQIWVNLAVGIIGSEDNPANLIYAGVIVVALAGSAASALRPRGLAAAMVATAIAQASTFVVALAAGFGFTGPITIFFTCLWLIAAALFRRAAEAEARSGA